MKSLKKELFFKFANRNWLRLHYANEKFDLFFNYKSNKIYFHLTDKNEKIIYLSGLVFYNNDNVIFEYNKQESAWFENSYALKKTNITDLLENLFCSMLIQGDSE